MNEVDIVEIVAVDEYVGLDECDWVGLCEKLSVCELVIEDEKETDAVNVNVRV